MSTNNLASVPEFDQSGVDVDKLDLKRNLEALIERGINLMPGSGDMVGQSGRPLIINALESGPAINQPMDLGLFTLVGYRSKIPDAGEFTGTTLTIDSIPLADLYCGRTIVMNSASSQTIIVAAAATDGFNCSVFVKGAGQVTVVPGSGLTLRSSIPGHSKSANQYARLGIEIIGTNLSFFGNTSA